MKKRKPSFQNKRSKRVFDFFFPQWFIGICLCIILGIFFGTFSQIFLGTDRHSLLGTCLGIEIGYSQHFFSGTWIHFSIGLLKHGFLGILLHKRLGNFLKCEIRRHFCLALSTQNFLVWWFFRHSWWWIVWHSFPYCVS